MALRFGDFELDADLGELRHAGQRVAVQPKALALLIHLIQHRHRVVSRAELERAVWPDTAVTAASVGRALKSARRAVGDDGASQRVLRTVHGGGLRFAATVSASDAATAPAITTPYIGRAQLLQRLRAAQAAAWAGRGRIVLLVGEPGIGKTRTVEEMLGWAAVAGVPSVRATCPEFHGTPPWWPWQQLLRALAKLPRAPTERLADLADTLDGSIALPGADAIASAARPAGVPFAIFETLNQLLGAIGVRGPVCLAIDDLHWAGDGALALLDAIASGVAAQPILVLGALRNRELASRPPLARAFSHLLRHAAVERFEVAPLTAAEIGEFVRADTGDPPGPTLAHALAERTGGNPLYVQQVLRAGLAAALAADIGAALDALPRSVEAAIGARLAGLSANTRAVLRSAAILGETFSPSVLSRLYLDPAGVAPAIEEAAGARLVSQDGDASDRRRFAHALVRDVLYAENDPIERARLHHRAGQLLEALLDNAQLDAQHEISGHFLAAGVAGDPPRAVHLALHAAARAESVYAHERAAELYERASTLVAAIGEDDAFETWVGLARTRQRVGNLAEARAAAEEALRLARSSGRAEWMARAVFARAGIASHPQLPDGAVVALLEEALAGLEARSGALRARLLARLAAELYSAPDRARCIAVQADALEAARASGDPCVLVEVLALPYAGIWEELPIGERLPAADAGLAAARAAHPAIATDAAMLRIAELFARGDFARFDAEIDAVDESAHHSGSLLALILTDAYRCMRAVVSGDLDAAEARVQEAAARIARTGIDVVGTPIGLQRLAIRVEQGRAADVFAIAEAEARTHPSVAARALVAFLASEAGHAGEANAQLDRLERDGSVAALGSHPMNEANAYVLARSYATQGRRPPPGALEAVLERAAGRLVVRGLAAVHGLGDHGLALLATLRGDRDEAHARFDAALAMARRLGAARWLGRIERDAQHWS